MNPVQLTHPTPEQLHRFALGKLDEAEAAALEAHLAECMECSKALDKVPADEFVAGLRDAANTSSLADAATLTATPAIAAPTNGIPAELVSHPRYRILEALGAGGMGVVYKAEHLLMQRLVALKVINPSLTKDAVTVDRFRREVMAAARLCHPNIVAAYDAEQAGDVHFLVMEFVEGTSLDRLVAEIGPLPVVQACDYARQTALGLQHACERGMVHRDIKPQNLMRSNDTSSSPWGLVKILDFGLARFARELTAPAIKEQQAATAADGALTLTGAVMGTPDYMAPEQIRDSHTADIRADIYSLGCTLYFLIAGKVPFLGGTVVEKLIAHDERTPPPLAQARADVPPGLVHVVARMTAKDPTHRYQTPAEVARALEPFTTPTPATTLEPEAPAQPHRPRRLPSALIATAFLGSPILAYAVFALTGQREKVIEHMETTYTICVILGGTFLVLQFLMGLLGMGHHDGAGGDFHEAGGADGHAEGDSHDMSHDEHQSWFAGKLTLRTVSAGLTFFGLAGRAAAAADAEPSVTFALALGAGGGALFGVAYMMRALYRLRADGTVRLDRAVGHTGSVYLSVPGHKTGAGKVHLNLQNRTMEYQAITAQGPLPCGAKVVVVGLVSPDTVEVVLAPALERTTHV
jgi:serine/threonine protein kinase